MKKAILIIAAVAGLGATALNSADARGGFGPGIGFGIAAGALAAGPTARMATDMVRAAAIMVRRIMPARFIMADSDITTALSSLVIGAIENSPEHRTFRAQPSIARFSLSGAAQESNRLNPALMAASAS
jgi:hypothetical protein